LEYEPNTLHSGNIARRRQNATSGDKSRAHAGATSTNDYQSQQSSGGVDASAFTFLYKEIRDSMDAHFLGEFAYGNI